MKMKKVPYGYSFCPTDEELVGFLVDMKLERKSIPPFLEKTMYGNQLPWEVLKENDPSWEYSIEGDSKTVFVFTPLSFRGTNKVLGSGTGTWEGKSVNQEIKNRHGQLIGNKKAFTFRMDKSKKKEKNQVEENNKKERWIMYQYTTSLVEGDYALCKITVTQRS